MTRSLVSSLTPARPRWATPRTGDRPTYGPAAARLATLLGRPFMPWQREVADVGLEVDPGTGRLAWPVVVVSVPRQSGKSTLVMVKKCWRCLAESDRRTWYTAQTGQDARDQWLELVGRLSRSALAPAFTVRRTNGAEAIEWRNGSTLRPFPPVPDALHGRQSDDTDIDEAWSHSLVRGAELEQAIVPTMATRQPGAQLWILSTAGTRESEWLWSYVLRGRAGQFAYFEWSIADDVDPTDLDAVAAAHPAHGHTQTRDALAAALATMGPDAFARAYGNRWTTTTTSLYPPTQWAAAATLADPPERVDGFGADVAADRSSGTIVAVAGGILEVVEPARVPLDRLAPRVLELMARWPAAPVAIDGTGPALTLADTLTRAGTYSDGRKSALGDRLLILTGRQYAGACSGFYDDLAGAVLRYRPHPDLDAAAAGAVRRPLGDAWTLARRSSVGNIAPLVAANLAWWARGRTPAPMPRPQVYAG